MKKSTLLTVASVGAVALTSAMTFAAWDNLTATTTNTVTFDRIDVTATTSSEAMTVKARTPDTLGADTVSATSEIEVDLSTVKDTDLKEANATELLLTPEVKVDGKTTENYEVKIQENSADLLGAQSTGYTDSTLDFTNTKNKYTVVVSPKDTATANENVTVEVTAKFQKAATN